VGVLVFDRRAADFERRCELLSFDRPFGGEDPEGEDLLRGGEALVDGPYVTGERGDDVGVGGEIRVR